MVRKLLMVLCIAFIPLVGICPPISDTQRENIIYECKKHIFYLTIFNKPFTPDLLKQAMIFEGIQSPEIAFRQAQLETGWFTSDLFLNANNLFGMRYAQVRDTYASGEYKNHAEYKTWLSSVKDYALWQKWYIDRGHDITNYYVFLKKVGYATDKRYINKLKEIG